VSLFSTSGVGASPQDYDTSGMAQHNARDDGWHDTNNTDHCNDTERQMFSNFKLTYQTGKNNHLVLISFPSITITAMVKLTDTSMRQCAGINASNV